MGGGGEDRCSRNNYRRRRSGLPRHAGHQCGEGRRVPLVGRTDGRTDGGTGGSGGTGPQPSTRRVSDAVNTRGGRGERDSPAAAAPPRPTALHPPYAHTAGPAQPIQLSRRAAGTDRGCIATALRLAVFT